MWGCDELQMLGSKNLKSTTYADKITAIQIDSAHLDSV